MSKVLVTARGLIKKFGSLVAVDGIDFDVHEKECFGFLGPNGAGKTSTMKMLYCSSPITSGTARVLGLDPKSDDRKLKAKLGVVPQEDNLDPDLSVKQNLLVYARYFNIKKKVAVERAEELMKFFQLTEKSDQKIDTISGGMRRRLLLARGFVHNPELVILDEPTVGLDPQARHLVWQKLRLLKRSGVSMLLTTHYMDEAEQLCDRLVIMDKGRFLDEGNPKELISKHVGVEVIELRIERVELEKMVAKIDGEGVEHEYVADTLYIFLKDSSAASNILKKVDGFDFLHRRATLEDVYLKITGRELRE